MPSTTTVRRNATKLRAQIRANYTEAYVRSLDNGFVAQPVTDLEWMWNRYEQSRNAILYLKDVGGAQHYIISVHGNLWFELYKPGTKKS